MLRAEPPEGWRRIWIVALREIRERGGSRSYRISTVLAVLLVVALIVLLVRSSSDSASSQPTAPRLPRRLAGR